MILETLFLADYVVPTYGSVTTGAAVSLLLFAVSVTMCHLWLWFSLIADRYEKWMIPNAVCMVLGRLSVISLAVATLIIGCVELLGTNIWIASGSVVSVICTSILTLYMLASALVNPSDYL